MHLGFARLRLRIHVSSFGEKLESLELSGKKNFSGTMRPKESIGSGSRSIQVLQKLRSPDQKKTGKNPTDRGKFGVKRSILTDSHGIPLSIILAGANVFDSKLMRATLKSIIVKRPRHSKKEQHLLADKAYNGIESRMMARRFGYEAHIRQKKNAVIKILRKPGRRKARRWVVERAFGHFNRARAILVRWEKEPDNYEALLHVAAGLMCFRRSKNRRRGY
jgi:putative transposase